jgi:hypothetical protein
MLKTKLNVTTNPVRLEEVRSMIANKVLLDLTKDMISQLDLSKPDGTSIHRKATVLSTLNLLELIIDRRISGGVEGYSKTMTAGDFLRLGDPRNNYLQTLQEAIDTLHVKV